MTRKTLEKNSFSSSFPIFNEMMGKTKFAGCKRKFYLKKQSVYPNYIKYMSTYRKCVLFLLGFINGSQERGSTRELCVQVIRHDTRLALTQPERRSSSSINFFIEPSRPRGRPRQSGLLFRWLPPLSQSRVFVVVVKHFISIRLKVTKKTTPTQHGRQQKTRCSAPFLLSPESFFSLLRSCLTAPPGIVELQYIFRPF